MWNSQKLVYPDPPVVGARSDSSDFSQPLRKGMVWRATLSSLGKFKPRAQQWVEAGLLTQVSQNGGNRKKPLNAREKVVRKTMLLGIFSRSKTST